MTTTEPKYRTYALTSRPPVRVREDLWPKIASAHFKTWDGQYEFQANETWRGTMLVRQHTDGRAIVWGQTRYGSNFVDRADWESYGGELLEPGDDIPAAINRVWDSLRHDGITDDLAAECIADLPPVDLD